MIAGVLAYVRKHFDALLRASLGTGPADAGEDRVVFPGGAPTDAVPFKNGAVSLLLLNTAEERLLRAAEPYLRRGDDGSAQRVQPDLRLELTLLFVARFSHYETAWSSLSSILQALQQSRVLDAGSGSGFPPGVAKLVFELVSLSLAEQNELWGALRTPHHPALMYRVQLVTFRDPEPATLPRTETVEIRLGQQVAA